MFMGNPFANTAIILVGQTVIFWLCTLCKCVSCSFQIPPVIKNQYNVTKRNKKALLSLFVNKAVSLKMHFIG